jgi:hypothetical protein
VRMSATPRSPTKPTLHGVVLPKTIPRPSPRYDDGRRIKIKDDLLRRPRVRLHEQVDQKPLDGHGVVHWGSIFSMSRRPRLGLSPLASLSWVS